MTLMFSYSRINQLLNQPGTIFATNLNENQKTTRNSLFNSFAKRLMLNIKPLDKHNSLLLIPHLQIFQPLLFRIYHKYRTICILHYFYVVEKIFVVVNSHLLQHYLIVFLQLPVHVLLIELDLF